MEWLIFSASILNLFLALFVWLRNPKNALNYFFGIFGIIAALLTFFDFLFRFFPNLFILRTTYALAALLPATASIWIIKICRIMLGKYSRFKNLFLLVPGVVFFIFSYINGFIVEEIYSLLVLGYKGRLGLFFSIYSIYFLIYTILLISLLYYTQRKASSLYKIQIRFVLFGISSYSLLAIFFSLILPTFFNNYNFTLLDAPSSIFFVGFTAYAITRYRLMDIRAIIFRTITFGFILLLITSIFAVIATLISSLFAEIAGVQSNIIAGLFIAFLVTTFYIPVRNLIERVTNTFLYKRAYNSDLLLSKVNEVTSSTLDLQELLTSVCNLIENAVNCEKIGVALLDEKKNKLKVTYKKGFLPGIAEMFVSFPGVVRLMFRQFQETPGIFVVDERKV